MKQKYVLLSKAEMEAALVAIIHGIAFCDSKGIRTPPTNFRVGRWAELLTRPCPSCSDENFRMISWNLGIRARLDWLHRIDDHRLDTIYACESCGRVFKRVRAKI